MLDSFIQGAGLLMRVDIYVYISVGLALGMFVGAMPGLTTTLAMAILLPITFHLEPMLGIPFLIGLYKGGIYGGSVSAILVGIPGTGASVATTFDGPALTRMGKARKALEMALYASVTGDFLSDVFTLFAIGAISLVILSVGPPEVFAIIIFSLVLISSVSGNSGVKGMIVACMGLILGFIGTDAATGVTRMTFGINALSGGIPLIPLVIGVFAIPEVLEAVESRASRFIDDHVDLSKQGEPLRWHEFRKSLPTIFRSTAIGTGIGMVPGIGQLVAAFIAYSAAKRASKTPENFGKGDLDGIAAPEAANNAVNGPTLVPLLTLGIPGDNITAILLGAFVAHGLRPGPQVFVEQGPLVYAILLSIIVANIFFLGIGYVLIKPFSRAIQTRKAFLVPIILTLAFVGTLSTGVYSDIVIMIVIGVVAYVLRKMHFQLAPLVIAFVLCEPIEYRLSQNMLFAKGHIFQYLFIERPIASVFMTAAVIWAAYLILRPLVRRYKAARGRSHRNINSGREHS